MKSRLRIDALNQRFTTSPDLSDLRTQSYSKDDLILPEDMALLALHRVMLDVDLANLYGVETGALNRAVRRNQIRFPQDFMFQLTEKEEEFLRCQIGISNDRLEHRGGRRYLPLVFTEQGVAMLSSVLRSERAVLVNIEIIRTFVRLREILLSNQDLAKKLNDLETKYDAQFKEVFDAIRILMQPPILPPRRIGI